MNIKQLRETKILKMQLGRRAAYLIRCITVAELLKEKETSTSIRKRVFEESIKPVIRCSYQTFNKMLNEPNPQRQLEKIQEKLKNLDVSNQLRKDVQNHTI